MTIEATTRHDAEVTCANCEACCCRLEVLLITETGVPETYIETDRWGGRRMARLDDGWCSALDRNTMLCMIYERRPWVCREFETGSFECLAERAANL
ncbi:MAG: YkgJ family cysteine cluster protein [Gammaproteobacteria bacterium]